PPRPHRPPAGPDWFRQPTPAARRRGCPRRQVHGACASLAASPGVMVGGLDQKPHGLARRQRARWSSRLVSAMLASAAVQPPEKSRRFAGTPNPPKYQEGVLRASGWPTGGRSLSEFVTTLSRPGAAP